MPRLTSFASRNISILSGAGPVSARLAVPVFNAVYIQTINYNPIVAAGGLPTYTYSTALLPPDYIVPADPTATGGASGGVGYGGGATNFYNYSTGTSSGDPNVNYGANGIPYGGGGVGERLNKSYCFDYSDQIYPCGGGGGFSAQTFSYGALTVSSTISVTVGSGGSGYSEYIGSGADGAVTISWS
jgi:hypothetical protein